MNMRKSMMLIAMGVGGTLLYQQVRNGNARKMMRDVENGIKKIADSAYDELEDMM